MASCSSGELHTYRLAVPSPWPDILQKIKAAGSNAISVYVHWGAINPAPGVTDFDGYRAVEPSYSMEVPGARGHPGVPRDKVRTSPRLILLFQCLLPFSVLSPLRFGKWSPISPRLNITIDSVLNGGVGNVVANNPPWGSRGRY